jgi:hypothetical protein
MRPLVFQPVKNCTLQVPRGLNRSKTRKYVDAARDNNAPSSRTMRIVSNTSYLTKDHPLDAAVAERRGDLIRAAFIGYRQRHEIEQGSLSDQSSGVVLSSQGRCREWCRSLLQRTGGPSCSLRFS